MLTMPVRSAAGNTTRHSAELNGPMTANTLSSSASLRRPPPRRVRLAPAVDRVAPALLAADAPGRVDLVDRNLSRDLVGPRQGGDRPCQRRQIAQKELLRLRRSSRRVGKAEQQSQ